MKNIRDSKEASVGGFFVDDIVNVTKANGERYENAKIGSITIYSDVIQKCDEVDVLLSGSVLRHIYFVQAGAFEQYGTFFDIDGREIKIELVK